MLTINDRQISNLRTLRLYHWERCLKLREWARKHLEATQYTGAHRRALGQKFADHADFHLKQVQVLNDFFPVGDTAEQDISIHKESSLQV